MDDAFSSALALRVLGGDMGRRDWVDDEPVGY